MEIKKQFYNNSGSILMFKEQTGYTVQICFKQEFKTIKLCKYDNLDYAVADDIYLIVCRVMRNRLKINSNKGRCINPMANSVCECNEKNCPLGHCIPAFYQDWQYACHYKTH